MRFVEIGVELRGVGVEFFQIGVELRGVGAVHEWSWSGIQ